MFKSEEYFNKGDVYMTSGNYILAILDFSKIIEMNGEYLDEAFASRGICKEELGDYEGAIDDFTKAIDIYPKSEELYAKRDFAKGRMAAG